jgi:hypothetical protein
MKRIRGKIIKQKQAGKRKTQGYFSELRGISRSATMVLLKATLDECLKKNKVQEKEGRGRKGEREENISTVS